VEGPSIRSFPRLSLDHPVELRLGKKTIKVAKPRGNLSAGGLFLLAKGVPENAPVKVKISGRPVFEAEGVVRFSEPRRGGCGIEFTAVNAQNRKRLEGLIAALLKKEALCA